MVIRGGRLVHVGNVLVDVVATVDALPAAGGDVLAATMGATVGGGFNLMVAAARQGLGVGYAGAHGSGPFGELARAALAAAGIAVLLPPRPTDTGVVIVIVDADGERTLVSSPAAVANATAAELSGVRPAADDAVSITGYALLEPAGRDGLLGWVCALPAGTLVVLDPGPLAPAAEPAALAALLARADWCTASTPEAAEITGESDPLRAAAAVARRTRRGALVRTGAGGCVLVEAGGAPLRLPGVPVTAVDTTGAGDAHTGAFIAALMSGETGPTAARRANAAAAYAVTVPGPATAPTGAELAQFLAALPPER
jgi:sugar/nucleoside kinase (ribokinase family)